ncbi:MAG: alpha/beta-hydrolase family protein [Pararhodobacter sp.]|nr:alpha/beta-hydrolase family protein [Pararhodobacter sp.]
MQLSFEHRSLLAPLAPFALIVAALGFTIALTPSLIPRTGGLQGVLAGAAFVTLYALAAGVTGIWRWLGLPVWNPRWLIWATKAVALAIMAYGLAQVTEWQNAVNAVAGMAPVETARPFIIAGFALAVILPALALGRLVRLLVVSAANRLARFLPVRLALGGALVLTAVLFWTVGNGVLGSAILRALDSAAQQVDALILDEQPRPVADVHSGSAGSLLDWTNLGAAGRARVSSYPTTAEIAELAGPDGPPVQTPVRVYVGLNSAETPEERAELALAELIRTDAFSRKILIIGTPTGTGWIHPASLSVMEFFWRGDVASVAVQYSYLPSWLTLLIEPEYGAESARALFRVIHDHWRSLPEDTRPRLYLYGLSLGARNSELSADVWDILSAPYDGAFWVGPTFTNPLWQEFTARRNPDSPAWRPVVGSGSLVRFASQQGIPDHGNAPWGPVRILYLQYPSDAITFFYPESLYRPPDWLSPRAPDVSPAFRWVPVVTFLQLLADLVAAFGTPIGVGHAYAARDFINGWYALSEPPGWDADRLEALRAWYVARGR